VPFQMPQNGVVADWHAETFHQPFSRRSTSAVAETMNKRGPARPPVGGSLSKTSSRALLGRSWPYHSFRGSGRNSCRSNPIFRAVADFYTALDIVLGLASLPLLRPFKRLLERMLPDRIESRRPCSASLSRCRSR
jgi:hypothetical protein